MKRLTLAFLLGLAIGLGVEASASAPLTLVQGKLVWHEGTMFGDSYFNVSTVSIAVPERSTFADILRLERDQIVKITIQRVEKPTLEVIQR